MLLVDMPKELAFPQMAFAGAAGQLRRNILSFTLCTIMYTTVQTCTIIIEYSLYFSVKTFFLQYSGNL